jgi:hypothetical protein
MSALTSRALNCFVQGVSQTTSLSVIASFVACTKSCFVPDIVRSSAPMHGLRSI